MQNQNKLILGDCLEIMKTLPAESVDLIYLDPPFFSNRNYEIIWGDEGEIRSFEDRWSGGIDQYINWLYDRVAEMHRLLKPTGSIYLHCDWHADAYIRVGILDKIFGYRNLVSDITWKRTTAKSNSKRLANNSDTIFCFSKEINKSTYNQIFLPIKDGYKNSHYNKSSEFGRIYRTDNLKAPGKGYIYEWNGISANWRCPIEKMKEHENNGRIKYTKNGIAEYIRYLDESLGVPIDNVWGDINPVNSQANERIGYPTQKPLALLERIIKASSNEGDIVLDPFMGGGTTMIMASRLQRNFIGIDQSIAAVDVTDKRLQAEGLFTEYSIEKHYYAEEDLKSMDAFEFERWIVQKFGGKPNTQQRGDFGSDGEKDGVPIQVKRWKNKVGRVEIQKFFSVCHAGRKFKEKVELGLPVGYFIAFEFAKEAVAEMARLKMDERILIEKVLVSDIVPMAKKPTARIEYQRLPDGKYEFKVISDSEIVNYSWDFNYPVPAHKHPDEVGKFNPSVLYDKKGVRTHLFAQSGTHNIAVKVVDDKFLENIAIVSVSVE